MWLKHGEIYLQPQNMIKMQDEGTKKMFAHEKLADGMLHEYKFARPCHRHFLFEFIKISGISGIISRAFTQTLLSLCKN